MLTNTEIQQMLKIATETRANAFAIRSNHKVGACVLTRDGQFFGGCNTEGVISSLGVCAEMSAMDHAVIHGHYQLKALCVVDTVKTYPCGACLQYLSQFYQIDDREITIIVSDLNGNYETKTLSELLPEKYLSQHLDKEIEKYKK